MLETHQLTKRYGSQTVLKGVDLQVSDDSIYGLVGPNGAGKTTLLSIIAGLRRPTAGTMTLNVDQPAIAVCPDVPEFEPWLTALEVMQLAAQLIHQPLPDESLKQLLAEAGLADSWQRKVGGFSRGMTQRLALAATFVGDPKFVILDEPCSALDPSGRVEVLDTIARMGRRATIIFSTHILADVQRVCNQIGVLDKGTMLYQGSLEAFVQDKTAPIWNLSLRGDVTAVQAALTKCSWIKSVQALSNHKLQVIGTSAAAVERQLIQVLADTKAQVVAIEPVENDLEQAFLNLTQAKSGDRS